MKNKKVVYIVIILIVIIIAIVGVTVYFKNKNSKKPQKILQDYISYISNKEYDKMYGLLDSKSKEKISQEDFVARNKNIYEGIEASNINLEIKEAKKEDKNIFPYHISMDTVAGKVDFDTQVQMTKEDNNYLINWSSNLIFPELEDTDKVRVTTLEADRGNIYDRNDILIAGKGNVSSVGLVPGKMNKESEQDIEQISNLLKISKETIQNKLSASYVKDDTFVPIKMIANNQQELENALLKIPGIKISNAEARVYPYEEVTSHLLRICSKYYSRRIRKQ